jgi:FMN reductase [NAD(P)H]
MNETIRSMQSHRSTRSYTSAPVSEAHLEEIVEATRRGPTSNNGQQVSLVVVRDAARRARIAEIAGGQSWIAQAPVFIAVVVDFHKTRLAVEKAGKKQLIHESVEGLIVGAVDAGITLGNLMTAARSLGLGIVPIGGIRNDPQAMIDLLELPPLTFPVVGVSIGHVAAEAAQKPRLPLPSFRHQETYHGAGLPALIDAYDAELLEHWKRTGRPAGQSWSASIAQSYGGDVFRHIKAVVAKQGFLLEK